jgi:hypothetical protein
VKELQGHLEGSRFNASPNQQTDICSTACVAEPVGRQAAPGKDPVRCFDPVRPFDRPIEQPNAG